MPFYTLKRYNREVPDESAGKLFAEWAVKAHDVEAAVAISHKLLAAFRPPEDFAILWDESGKPVWETGY